MYLRIIFIKARHVWKLINYSLYVPLHLRDIVDVVISHNAFWAHSENLLLAMMFDDRPHIRKLAFMRVAAARAKKSSSIRIFKVPQLRFEAHDYYNMMDWST